VADEFRPQVVLLDIGLPKMNGYDVCRAIRQEPWGQNMVLIAVTGWGQDKDKQQSEVAGFDRHIVKPVDPRKLMEVLAEFEIVLAR
jgi:CheY-like chemotaxis protein